jgi:hypothetical protein
VYAEFKWGELLFPEGRRVYDLARDRLMTEWKRDELYVAPDDYAALFRRYDAPLSRQAARRLRTRVERTAAGLLRR